MNGMRRKEDEDVNEGDEGDCTWELYNYKAGAATVPQSSSERASEKSFCLSTSNLPKRILVFLDFTFPYLLLANRIFARLACLGKSSTRTE